MKHLFIINPTSGNGKSYELISVIQDYFKGKEEEYAIYTTEAPGHATRLASEHPDVECIYSVGGDGTAYEILNGLGEGVQLGIIPAGSGNDYSEMIGYKTKNLPEIIRETVEGRVVSVDYGFANGHKFLNCFCLGVDAAVVEHANQYSKKYPIPNKMSYMVSALKAILNPKPIHAEAVVDGEETKMDAILMAVMNGQYYGGGFHSAPTASIQDGFLNVVFVDFLKLTRILPLLPKYFSGKHEGIDEIHNYNAKSITIKTDKEWVYCVDGEIYYDSLLNVEVVENGLLLRVPQESELK